MYAAYDGLISLCNHGVNTFLLVDSKSIGEGDLRIKLVSYMIISLSTFTTENEYIPEFVE